VVPARFLVSLLRGVLLKGAGWGDVWTDLVGLAAFGVVTIGLSARNFHRRIA
jgi:ABC-2 type transport system permease protein